MPSSPCPSASSSSSFSTTLAVALALSLALGAASCSSGSPNASPSTSPSTSHGTSASTKTKPSASHSSHRPAGPRHSPLTGERVTGKAPKVLIVKIDNTHAAHPQSGLNKADVVYVEEVEFGLTRLAAVFASRLPALVGPVRSARISDLELFRNYGNPVFAYSGAQHKLLDNIRHSPFVNRGEQVSSLGFSRLGIKPAPYNLYVHPKRLMSGVKHSSPTRDIGFRFGAPPARGGRTVHAATVTYTGATVHWSWDGKSHRYELSMDGSPATVTGGGRLGGATVVIQYCKVGKSGFGDKFGGKTPLINSVGKGSVLVLRGGKAYRGIWKRPKRKSPTVFTSNGKRLNFAHGKVWVVLANRKHRAKLS